MESRILFIQIPVEGHLGYFQFLSIMNIATINTHIQVFERKFSFLSGKYLKVGSLGYKVSKYFTL